MSLLEPEFFYCISPPLPNELNELRFCAKWSEVDESRLKSSLHNSLYIACIRVKKTQELVAFGRVVGDGFMYFYLQDLLVKEKYRKRGFAKFIMDALMNYVEGNAPKNSHSFIGLMSAPDLEGFYSRYGFAVFPDGEPAMWIRKTDN